MANSKVENSAQVLFFQLKFVHGKSQLIFLMRLKIEISQATKFEIKIVSKFVTKIKKGS
jgi:hypothetical protein